MSRKSMILLSLQFSHGSHILGATCFWPKAFLKTNGEIHDMPHDMVEKALRLYLPTRKKSCISINPIYLASILVVFNITTGTGEEIRLLKSLPPTLASWGSI